MLVIGFWGLGFSVFGARIDAMASGVGGGGISRIRVQLHAVRVGCEGLLHFEPISEEAHNKPLSRTPLTPPYKTHKARLCLEVLQHSSNC